MNIDQAIVKIPFGPEIRPLPGETFVKRAPLTPRAPYELLRSGSEQNVETTPGVWKGFMDVVKSNLTRMGAENVKERMSNYFESASSPKSDNSNLERRDIFAKEPVEKNVSLFWNALGEHVVAPGHRGAIQSAIVKDLLASPNEELVEVGLNLIRPEYVGDLESVLESFGDRLDLDPRFREMAETRRGVISFYRNHRRQSSPTLSQNDPN